jgi:tRNA threonylcarbamoyladenosine biosynthesis protein TsaB
VTPPFALAIEISNPTSGPRGPRPDGLLAGAGVALGRIAPSGAPEVIGAELLHEGSRHDDDLMPAIDRLCRAHHIRPRDLGHIAISIGPGGYTSLRIAVATAKMLALATGARTIPVPSAAVAAWPLTIDRHPAIVCLASKGQTAFATRLPDAACERWATGLEPLGLVNADRLADLRPATVVADRFLPDAMRAAAERLGATVIEPVFAASSVLALAPGAPPVDPLALAPVYSREADAVTQWRQRRGG